jgi:hypothetical protein
MPSLHGISLKSIRYGMDSVWSTYEQGISDRIQIIN